MSLIILLTVNRRPEPVWKLHIYREILHLAVCKQCECFLLGADQVNIYSRLHVKEVAHGHVGVALAVAVALREELVLGPGHVNALGLGVGLVVYRGVGRRVPVVDELGLERKQREGWRKRRRTRGGAGGEENGINVEKTTA